MSQAGNVLAEVKNGVATLTLNRPERLNAIDATMAAELRSAVLDVVNNPEVRAICLLGAGRAFCAGGDVAEIAGLAKPENTVRELAEVINDAVLALVSSSVPVVCAAHGTTAGGGLGLLLATDYAVIGESSQVGSIYANVGLTPDLSVTAQLARAVGERRALALTLQPRMLRAEEALDWGLVAEVVADTKVQDRAREIAHHWAQFAPSAYGQAKRLIRAGVREEFSVQIADEARTIGAAASGNEARTKMGDFLKK